MLFSAPPECLGTASHSQDCTYNNAKILKHSKNTKTMAKTSGSDRGGFPTGDSNYKGNIENVREQKNPVVRHSIYNKKAVILR